MNNGGDGVDRRLRFLEPMTVNIIAGHRKIPPYGLCGGGSGALGKNYVIHSDESVTHLGTKGQIEVSENDLFILKTPGGGGFGKTI
jgi:5-oxoprolinase (ATP-hydrolysing)